MSESLLLTRGPTAGCFTPPILFNIYYLSVIKQEAEEGRGLVKLTFGVFFFAEAKTWCNRKA